MRVTLLIRKMLLKSSLRFGDVTDGRRLFTHTDVNNQGRKKGAE